MAKGREANEKTVRQWIDKGLFSAAEANQQGIIDNVEFRHDFIAALKSRYGEKVKFDMKYGKKKQGEIDLSSPFGILKFYADLLSGPKTDATGKPAVAIVYVEGPIVPGKPDPDMFPFSSEGIAYSTPIRNALEKAAADGSVKAVVLRVNSPGGSAVASEVILQATRRVKEKKPLWSPWATWREAAATTLPAARTQFLRIRQRSRHPSAWWAGKFVTRAMWDKVVSTGNRTTVARTPASSARRALLGSRTERSEIVDGRDLRSLQRPRQSDPQRPLEEGPGRACRRPRLHRQPGSRARPG